MRAPNYDKYLQCGYEDYCKSKKCLKCRKLKQWYKLNLSVAEQVAIEDFAMCDLKIMIEEKPKQVNMLQGIMRRLMCKVFAEERKNDKKQNKKIRTKNK